MKTVIFFLTLTLAAGTATAGPSKSFRFYGGAGASSYKSGNGDHRDFGFALSTGVGRDLTRLGEVVVKGAYLWLGDQSQARTLRSVGLYLKMNLRNERQRSWVYLQAGGGGLTVFHRGTSSSYYFGAGIGGVINVENSRKLNLELQVMVPSSGGHNQSWPFAFLTFGVAL